MRETAPVTNSAKKPVPKEKEKNAPARNVIAKKATASTGSARCTKKTKRSLEISD
jgi:hypothetical protein